jgi:microcystin-dependent protein
MDALFVGQLALMPYGFTPSGWFECDGRYLNKTQYGPLFNVIGTTYGGTNTTFNLPDFRGRAMVGRGAQSGGATYEVGQTGGLEAVAISTDTMPYHNHALVATNATASTNSPAGALLAAAKKTDTTSTNFGLIYNPAKPSTALVNASILNNGASFPQPHNNMQPCVALRYCIAYQASGPEIATYLGQIENFGFDFAPKGWVPCAGQLLSINTNLDLFQLLGTYFGGDGIRTFALPDLRGRTPIGQGNGTGLTPRPIGTATGELNHLLTIGETPAHGHALQAAALAKVPDPNSTFAPDGTMALATSSGQDGQGNPLGMNVYAKIPPAPPAVTMAAGSVGSAGGDVHANMMPYLAVTPCISTTGIKPYPNG